MPKCPTCHQPATYSTIGLIVCRNAKCIEGKWTIGPRAAFVADEEREDEENED